MPRSVKVPRLIAVLLFLSATMPVQAEKYVNAENNFSVEIPPGWKLVTPQILAVFNSAQAKMGTENAEFVAGYTASKDGFDCPFVLIQVSKKNNHQFTTYAQIEKELGRDLNKTIEIVEQMGDRIKNTEFNNAFLDRSRNRILFQMQTDVPKVGTLQCLFATNLGRLGCISVCCSDRKASFEKNYPTFMSMNDSFRFEDGFAWVPLEVKFRWIGFVLGGLIVFIFVISGIIFVVKNASNRSRKAKKKKKRRKVVREIEEDDE